MAGEGRHEARKSVSTKPRTPSQMSKTMSKLLYVGEEQAHDNAAGREDRRDAEDLGRGERAAHRNVGRKGRKGREHHVQGVE